MKTRTLTRYRLRWVKLPGEQQALFFGCGELARVSRIDPDETWWRAELKPTPMRSEIAYEGPSRYQAKRAASMAIRLFMCREVDGQDLLGKRVKRGRVRR